MDYASTLWYNSITHSEKQVTQNKLIKFVFNLDTRSRICKEQFSFLNWLPMSSGVDLKQRR